MGQPLISVSNLTIQFRPDDVLVTAVDGASFELHAADILGLVVEPGPV